MWFVFIYVFYMFICVYCICLFVLKERLKVFINGRETNVNALDFLKLALDVRTGKTKSLDVLLALVKESDNNE